MTASSKNNFTVADIERYHAGKMSVQERHALEKAALDDPFLADALEGYVHTSSATKDIEQLKTRLAEKTGRKKAIPFFQNYTWLKAAAVFLVVAGGSWLAYHLFDSRNNVIALEPSQQKQKKAETVQAPSVTDSITMNKNDAVVSNQNAKEQEQNSDYRMPDQKLETQSSQNTHTATGNNNVNFQAVPPPETRLNKLAKPESTLEQNSNGLVMQDRVNPSLTDNNTNFKKLERAQNKQPAFDSTPLGDVSLKERNPIKNDTLKNMNVVLTPIQSAPPEVVVINKEKKDDTPAVLQGRMRGIVVDTLEGEEGYVVFDDYVADHLKRPEELKTKPMTGEVELGFDVNDEGQAVNIKVLKSLCTKCDEEAIRLLKEGPKWKKKKKKNRKVTIRF